MLIKILTCSSSSVVRYGNVPVVARATLRLQLYTGGCRYFKNNVSVYLLFDILKWHINPLHFIYFLFSFAIAYDCSHRHPIKQEDHVDMCSSLQECSHFTSLLSLRLYCALRVAHTHIFYQLNIFQPELAAVNMLGEKSEISNTFFSFLVFFFPDRHN